MAGHQVIDVSACSCIYISLSLPVPVRSRALSLRSLILFHQLVSSSLAFILLVLFLHSLILQSTSCHEHARLNQPQSLHSIHLTAVSSADLNIARLLSSSGQSKKSSPLDIVHQGRDGSSAQHFNPALNSAQHGDQLGESGVHSAPESAL